MSAISTILTRLRAAIWAIDVRDDIANAIEQCYSDVSNPTLKTEALEAALQNKIDQGEMAALTIGDHTITAAKLASGVIDNTLSTSGAAADAAETGRQIGLLKAGLYAQVGVFTWIEGKYINLTTDPVSLTPTANNVWTYTAVDCSAGDVFVINAEGGNAPRAWGFIDSSNHILSVADAQATVTELELTAPTGAVKLIINDKSGGTSYKVGNNIISRISKLEKDGLSDTVKEALLICFDKVAWSDSNGQNYYNNLCEALGIELWDFSWDASSGQLPTGMTYATEYTPAFADNAVHILRPDLVFNNNGSDCEIEVEIKSDSTSNLSSSNPQIVIKGASSGNSTLGIGRFILLADNQNNYLMDRDNNENVNCGVNQFNTFHKLNIRLSNGIFTFKIDGNIIGSGSGKDVPTSTILHTGIFSTGKSRAYVYIKSIKYRLLS